jgi:hypothetical protein
MKYFIKKAIVKDPAKTVEKLYKAFDQKKALITKSPIINTNSPQYFDLFKLYKNISTTTAKLYKQNNQAVIEGLSKVYSGKKLDNYIKQIKKLSKKIN